MGFVSQLKQTCSSIFLGSKRKREDDVPQQAAGNSWKQTETSDKRMKDNSGRRVDDSPGLNSTQQPPPAAAPPPVQALAAEAPAPQQEVQRAAHPSSRSAAGSNSSTPGPRYAPIGSRRNTLPLGGTAPAASLVAPLPSTPATGGRSQPPPTSLRKQHKVCILGREALWGQQRWPWVHGAPWCMQQAPLQTCGLGTSHSPHTQALPAAVPLAGAAPHQVQQDLHPAGVPGHPLLQAAPLHPGSGPGRQQQPSRSLAHSTAATACWQRWSWWGREALQRRLQRQQRQPGHGWGRSMEQPWCCYREWARGRGIGHAAPGQTPCGAGGWCSGGTHPAALAADAVWCGPRAQGVRSSTWHACGSSSSL
jgi:hypothetical protein